MIIRGYMIVIRNITADVIQSLQPMLLLPYVNFKDFLDKRIVLLYFFIFILDHITITWTCNADKTYLLILFVN